ncbi:hemolysin family protein [Acidaminobacter hydrogenoformans]|uniref:Putative hemolysin n=1 Tax=Acidaminobacter hydrogenoformans DSM 2784 TaxID=1120920 RepID=A0A1G5S5Z1_9FIRM|nr:hemolysin family protein [Acidaminobacter hydrogenoformans]SCZ81765.1 putative hemolysin [Acidaminobacter hydrogenoformans DSM 2784]
MTPLVPLAALILLNGFFSASEIALISLNDKKIQAMAEDGHLKAIKLRKILGSPSRFLATIQVGITTAGFLASAFAALYYTERLTATLKTTLGGALGSFSLSDDFIRNLAVILITLILSYFSLVLGELVPKRLASHNAESFAMAVIGPVTLLSKATYPFVRFLTLSSNFFVRLFGIDPHQENENVTEEEIRMMVDVGEEKGTIEIDEKEMINNIFEFNDKTVDDIMTHRMDIVSLPIEANLDETVALINEEKYSRIPVYEDTIDNIVGILFSKDIIQYLAGTYSTELSADGFTLQPLLRKPYFVPTSKHTDDLLRDFKVNKVHMAVIIDEYGGTAGIVTLEDLLEEIVGDISDEDDEDDLLQDITPLEDGSFLVEGLASLEDLESYFKVNLPTEEFKTVTGFIIGELGNIPEEGEHPTFDYEGLTFLVLEVDDKRVTKIRVVPTLEVEDVMEEEE